MVSQDSKAVQLEQSHGLQLGQSSLLVSQEQDSRSSRQIRICIPKNYHEEPVISRLVSHHGLIVNIKAALLGANARDDGWFDLELRGTDSQIQSALVYFNELDLETWLKPNLQEDSFDLVLGEKNVLS